MANTTINPTRMELSRLKKRLRTATRGHKLLKDKRDELMKQFLEIVRRNRELRKRVERGLEQANGAFTIASAVMSPEMLEQALLYPKQSVELEVGFRNMMSVNVPTYTFHTRNEDPADIFPYGFAQTSGELDAALEALSSVFRDMLELAEVEKTMQLLAQDIEKTRRRVNALEYVMIPDLQKNIRYISMKLEGDIAAYFTSLRDLLLGAMDNDCYPFAEISRNYDIQPNALFAYQGDSFIFDEIGGCKASRIPLELSAAKEPVTMQVFRTVSALLFPVQPQKLPNMHAASSFRVWSVT